MAPVREAHNFIFEQEVQKTLEAFNSDDERGKAAGNLVNDGNLFVAQAGGEFAYGFGDRLVHLNGLNRRGLTLNRRSNEIRQQVCDAPNLILRMTIKILPKIRIADLVRFYFFLQQFIRSEI